MPKSSIDVYCKYSNSKKVNPDSLHLWLDEDKDELVFLENVADKVVGLLAKEGLTVGASQVVLEAALRFILLSPVVSPAAPNGS